MGVIQSKGEQQNLSAPSSSLSSILLRLVILFAIDGFAIWFVLNLFADEVFFLAVAVATVTAVANIVILRRDAYPLRWMLVGLVFMMMFAIYPILFTIYVAFTNFGDGHLLTREQAINQISREKYLPEGGRTYTWTAFSSENGEFALWLQGEDTPGLLALPGQPMQAVSPGEAGVGELDSEGIPQTIDGYERLNRLTVLQFMSDLGDILFGEGEQTVQVRSIDEAAELRPRYVYHETEDTIIDQENGTVYRPIEGTFTAANGDILRPGYQTVVGISNFQRFFVSPALRGPLLQIITWNFLFAFFSVVTTFGLGLIIAFIYNDPQFPGRKLIRSLLLIPYTIPSLITILIWRGMLNPDIGVVNKTLESLFNTSPEWFTEPLWAKGAILLVNLWLGYPYFMLICSGALQAIPEDIYRAAEVDGANTWQRFRLITLPLLLVSVGPLLIASFTFNFNNFNLIFLFIQGGPPIAEASTRAGHTDILISYVYNLAFAGGRGADYGLASAITIVIFIIVAAITLFQFRYTRMWEEVSENV